MGQVGHGLHGFFEGTVPQLVEQQRQQNGRGKAEHNAQQGDGHGVAQHLEEAGRGEKQPEMLQAGPGASQDAQLQPKVFERQGHAVHGDILENHEIGDYDGKQRQQILVPADVFPLLLPIGVLDSAHADPSFLFLTLS